MTADLERFQTAQDGVFDTAMAELAAGRKASHSMWLVFPQVRSLGRSPTALFYGIASLAEARAYLAHPILGDRLARAAEAATTAPAASPLRLFGSPDDLKFRSSMTLFAQVSPKPRVFDAALARWALGPDRLTADLVEKARKGPDVL
ncbi:DUF1810 domain-containing protein [Brevundimonas sp. 'scallop']|uniref:DUF1810 domain-containing protein n=1 Tax=Brevundimonas sp. 'scallop' TaxID=2562582 RepID=UPI0013E1AFFF|nr:DUF1810 domain-containing protein [Brevundimonas sp. 'scallop']QIF82426.1 DUF1810 domain-containing protein [Brevundimonas sp. 'scallop']